MKRSKKINREASRRLFYTGRVRTGCFLMAAALICLSPGAGQVYADAAPAVKKTVSQNKVEKDADKNKTGKPAASSTVQPSAPPAASLGVTAAPVPPAAYVPQVTGLPQVTGMPQATPIPQITGSAQTTPVPQPAADEAEKDEETVKPSEEDEKQETGSTSEEETGGGEAGEDDVEPGTEEPEMTPAAAETQSPADDESSGGEGQDSQGEGQPVQTVPGSTDISGEENAGNPSEIGGGMSVQPSDTGYDDNQESSSYVEDEITAAPVVGVVEGASTIIAGGLAPAVPVGDSSQEHVNDEADGVNEEIEEEDGQEEQALIAGSTPLVGGVIAGDGYGNTGSKSKDKKKTTVTPKASAAPASSRSGGSGTSVGASSVTPSASTQNSSSAMDTSGQRSIVPAAAPSGSTNPGDGLRVAGVRTEDSTKILPLILIGAAALAAVAVLVVVKVRRGRKNLSDHEQE